MFFLAVLNVFKLKGSLVLKNPETLDPPNSADRFSFIQHFCFGCDSELSLFFFCCGSLNYYSHLNVTFAHPRKNGGGRKVVMYSRDHWKDCLLNCCSELSDDSLTCPAKLVL